MLRFFEFNKVKAELVDEPAIEIVFAEPINVILETTSVIEEAKSNNSDDSWDDVDDQPEVKEYDPSLVSEINQQLVLENDQLLKSEEDFIPENYTEFVIIDSQQPKPKVQKDKSEYQRYRFKDHFRCFICFTDFSSRKEKRIHMRTQHKKKNKCPCCVRPAFYSVCQYESHMRQHICGRYDKPSPNRLFACDLCGIQKLRLYYLEIHLKEHATAIENIRINNKVPAVDSAYPEPKLGPSRKKRFICKECEMKFETRFKWYHHYYNMHSSPICRYCKLTFNNRNTLKQHMNEQHANDEQPYTCEVCWKVMSSWVRFELHQRFHKTKWRNMDRERKYKCQLCDNSYKIKSRLDMHMEKYHKDGKEGFIKKQYHIASAERKWSEGPRNHECYICRKTFTKNAHRMRHIYEDHAEFKRVDCQLCSRTNIKSPAAYEMHLRMHELGFGATCPICGKQFYTRHRMTSHVSIAHEQKASICDLCGLITTRYKIRQHMRVKHLSRQLFNCHLCICKPFNTEISLQVHMSRKHEMSPLFHCAICNKGVNYEQSLKNHEMKCIKRIERNCMKQNLLQSPGLSQKQ